MKAVLVNMGFDAIPAMDVISYLKLGRGDIITLVSPVSRDEGAITRGEQARAQVRSYVAALRAAGRGITLNELAVDLSEPGDAFSRIAALAKSYKERMGHVVLELSGGARMLTALMVMMALLCPGLVDEVTLLNDVTRNRLAIPVSGLSLLPPGSKLRKVLGLIASKGGAKRAEIAEALDSSPASVSRAVTKLKRLGLVEERLRVLSLAREHAELAKLFSSLA
jgi:CRISPR locus-related DNA-binding protein